jgi:hypothetical protein
VQLLLNVLLLEAMIGGGSALRMVADERHDAGLQTGITVVDAIGFSSNFREKRGRNWA